MCPTPYFNQKLPVSIYLARHVNQKLPVSIYIDKQDPVLVTDIAKLHTFFENGATAVYMQMIFMLCRSFLDPSLTVAQRVYWIWRVKSLFVIWRQSVKTLHFITRETFCDIKSCCDAFIMYVLQINGSEVPLVPWFCGSDQNEQYFAEVRYGEIYILYWP